MRVRAIKAAAVLLLTVSIGALVFALGSSEQASRIQGPSALVAVDGREVWISVDDELWRVSPDGELRSRTSLASIGLPGPPANLAHHPSGAIVATVRDDPALYFIDATQPHVVRKIEPRWPSDLARHGARAINLAFHGDGRFAIATGGGHTVALFDAEGAYLARTPEGTYKFTNGLWWQDDALWTTDTNRYRLKRLDGTTLAVREERQLSELSPSRYLGPARAHPRAGPERRAALVRFRNGMVQGGIVAIGDGDREAAFPHAGEMEPRDFDWLGNGELLASDGATFSVLRWSADRQPLGAFGDAALRGHWDELASRRARLQHRYGVGIAAAIASFAVAFALALWAEWSGRRARQRRAPIDLSRLGTLRVSQGELIRTNLRVNAGVLWVGVSWALFELTPLSRWLDAAGGTGLRIGVLLVVIVAALISLPMWMRRLKRVSRESAFEPMFNALAVRKLEASDALGMDLRDGEHVLETFTWMRPTLHWAVLTNERLLVYVATLMDHRLQSQHALGDVVAVSTERGTLTPGQAQASESWLQWRAGGWLELVLRGGEVLSGAVSSATVAGRVVATLLRRPGVLAGGMTTARAQGSAGATTRQPDARTAALASALIPGLGQWMQRRKAAALLMFVPWALAMVTLFIPIVWTLYGPRAEVSTSTLASAAVLALFDAAFAAWDAWRMGPRTAA